MNLPLLQHRIIEESTPERTWSSWNYPCLRSPPRMSLPPSVEEHPPHSEATDALSPRAVAQDVGSDVAAWMQLHHLQHELKQVMARLTEDPKNGSPQEAYPVGHCEPAPRLPIKHPTFIASLESEHAASV